MKIFLTLLFAVFAFFMGWIFAHNVVAYECSVLGNFYVGRQVFFCDEAIIYPEPLIRKKVI